jgi:HAE1 family hydrophobic/amphiphilic exporter-1
MLFQELALVVVFALMCSLTAALTLVPMLASRFLTVEPDNPDRSKRPRTQRAFEALEARYARIVDGALRHRPTVALGAAGLLAAALVAFPSIPVELAPQTQGDGLNVNMRVDDGTNISVMYRYAELLDAAVREAIGPADVKFITTRAAPCNCSCAATIKASPSGSSTRSSGASKWSPA